MAYLLVEMIKTEHQPPEEKLMNDSKTLTHP